MLLFLTLPYCCCCCCCLLTSGEGPVIWHGDGTDSGKALIQQRLQTRGDRVNPVKQVVEELARGAWWGGWMRTCVRAERSGITLLPEKGRGGARLSSVPKVSTWWELPTWTLLGVMVSSLTISTAFSRFTTSAGLLHVHKRHGGNGANSFPSQLQVLPRAYQPAGGGERACNSHTASTEGEMLAVTKVDHGYRASL